MTRGVGGKAACAINNNNTFTLPPFLEFFLGYQRALQQPLSCAWTYVSAHYDTSRGLEQVTQCISLVHVHALCIAQQRQYLIYITQLKSSSMAPWVSSEILVYINLHLAPFFYRKMSRFAGEKWYLEDCSTSLTPSKTWKHEQFWFHLSTRNVVKSRTSSLLSTLPAISVWIIQKPSFCSHVQWHTPKPVNWAV